MKKYLILWMTFALVCSMVIAQEEDLSEVFEEVEMMDEVSEDRTERDEIVIESEDEMILEEEDNSSVKDIENFAETLDSGKEKSSLDALPEINEEQSKEISRLFEKAAKNYEDILDNRPEAEMRTNEERLKANEGLLHSNRDKLATSQSQLRRTKLQYIKRFLVLKNSYKSGNFTKETYDMELAKLAKSYEFKVRELADDKEFYKGELKQTKGRVKALDELNRINRIMHPKQAKNSSKKKTKKKPLTELEKMMKKVQSTSDWFDVKDVWDAPDRN